MTSKPLKKNPLRPERAQLTSLADQVYGQLRIGIISAQLPPGEKLVELDIAAEMGTSQGPVREALQRLERDGLVERRARKMTLVSNFSIDDMYELFSVRTVIEGFAIQRTARTITDDQCDELDSLVERMTEAGRQDNIVSLSGYDVQFHQRICEWAGSNSLLQAWMPLSSQIQRFVVQTHPERYPDFVDVAHRHQPIVDALRSHNAEQSARTVQEHIMRFWSGFNPASLKR
jgi:DNA-binding GntR family transcriptional regulator